MRSVNEKNVKILLYYYGTLMEQWLYYSRKLCNLSITFTPKIIVCSINSSLQRARTPSALFPLYLYPFLNTIYKTKKYEFLRLTSLGVIGALVKFDDHKVVAIYGQ